MDLGVPGIASWVTCHFKVPYYSKNIINLSTYRLLQNRNLKSGLHLWIFNIFVLTIQLFLVTETEKINILIYPSDQSLFPEFLTCHAIHLLGIC